MTGRMEPHQPPGPRRMARLIVQVLIVAVFTTVDWGETVDEAFFLAWIALVLATLVEAVTLYIQTGRRQGGEA